MQDLITFLKTAIALKARHGWILFIVCGGTLALQKNNVESFVRIQEGWLIAVGIGFLAGTAILFVCVGEWLIHRSRENTYSQNAIAVALENQQSLDDEAQSNLSLLNRDEKIALAYIFSLHNQRFRGEARYNVLSSLAAKNIIGTPISSSAHDIWMVRSSVWKLRERLLEEWKPDIYIPTSAPWDF